MGWAFGFYFFDQRTAKLFAGFFFDHLDLLISNFGSLYFYFIDGLLDSGRDRDGTRIIVLVTALVGGSGNLDVVWKEGVNVIDYRSDGFT